MTTAFAMQHRPNWPLVGRAAELAAIAAALRGREGARGVVLVGAAGVGKTRLAREALAAAATGGSGAHWVAATQSASGVPLGGFAPLLRHLDPDAVGIAALHGAATELLRDAPRAGIVVGIDDAHLLDSMSATLVHHLAVDRGVPLVMTLRSGEQVPDAVTALWKDGPLLRRDLQALTAAETAALLATVLGGAVEGDTAERMWSVTAGNVLYLRHLVDGELEASRLHRVAGVWRWRGDLTLPPPLRDLIDARIGRLPDAVREMLELVALAEPLDVDLLARLAEPQTIDLAEQRRLVAVTRSDGRLEVRLAHPLHGEAVRAALSTLRARKLRGLLAEALAGSAPQDVLRRAVLALDSDLPPDPELFRAAAVEANRLGALPLAERLAAAASVAGTSFDAELMLGYAQGWQGRNNDGAGRLAAAAALAATPEEQIRAAVGEVCIKWWGLGDAAGARAVLARELAVERPAAMRAELEGLRAVIVLLDGAPAEAVDLARAVLAGPQPSSRTVTYAGHALVAALAVTGRCDEALAMVEPVLAAAAALPDTAVLRAGIWDGHLMALRLTGRLAAAATAAAGYVADAGDSALMRCKAGLYQTLVTIDTGAAGPAVTALRDTIASFDGRDPSDWTYHCQVALATALGMTGDGAGATAALVAATALSRPTVTFFRPDVLLAQAWAAAADGAVTEAIAGAQAAAAAAAGTGRPAVESAALHVAVCFGDRAPAERLATLAVELDSPRAAAAAAHAAALAADDGTALDEASHSLAGMGVLLHAADAAAQAAQAHRRAGRRGAAAVATARSQQLALRCPGALTPALRASAHPLPITDREREIAMLVSAGLPNQAIAERLFVSVRTVEGHIYRACSRLGITDRAALGALVGAG
ncbi:AAA family ATPase [Pseudonocardia sp. GCM10023141]|uniref:AAA family ATPase n=1 Tax=Pseudonocardia sp. GCM10023141 TaxID=3252653 RepID=UPI0036241D49